MLALLVPPTTLPPRSTHTRSTQAQEAQVTMKTLRILLWQGQRVQVLAHEWNQTRETAFDAVEDLVGALELVRGVARVARAVAKVEAALASCIAALGSLHVGVNLGERNVKVGAPLGDEAVQQRHEGHEGRIGKLGQLRLDDAELDAPADLASTRRWFEANRLPVGRLKVLQTISMAQSSQKSSITTRQGARHSEVHDTARCTVPQSDRCTARCPSRSCSSR